MSSVNKLFKHFSQYLLAQILLTLSGLITFPIYTRLLSTADYGTLCLLTSFTWIAAPIAKLGIQHSSVRFYSEFKKQNLAPQFYSTLLIASLCSALIVGLIFMLIVRLFSDKINPGYHDLIFLIAAIVFCSAVRESFLSFLRAEQKTKAFNCIEVAAKYAAVMMSVFFVIYVMKNVFGILMGILLIEIAFLIYLSYRFSKYNTVSFNFFSPSFLAESIKYSMPLLMVEITGLLLANTDKYVIQYFLGASLLGIYSAGNVLSRYVVGIFNRALDFAIVPLYMSYWITDGEEKTKAFLSKSVRYFALIIIPASIGLISIDKEIIVFLASGKYLDSCEVIIYITIGRMIFAFCSIFSAGLYIYKKTTILLCVVCAAMVFNFALNILFVPWLGIKGAAITTLIVYSATTFSVVLLAFRYLSFRIDIKHVSLYLLMSSVMSLVIKIVQFNDTTFNLLAKIGIGLTVYCLVLVLVDKDVRIRIHNLFMGLRTNLSIVKDW